MLGQDACRDRLDLRFLHRRRRENSILVWSGMACPSAERPIFQHCVVSVCLGALTLVIAIPRLRRAGDNAGPLKINLLLQRVEDVLRGGGRHTGPIDPEEIASAAMRLGDEPDALSAELRAWAAAEAGR
jgi:hypothetical protein